MEVSSVKIEYRREIGIISHVTSWECYVFTQPEGEVAPGRVRLRGRRDAQLEYVTRSENGEQVHLCTWWAGGNTGDSYR